MIFKCAPFMLILHCVTPIFIRSGIDFDENSGQVQQSNLYDKRGEKGHSGVQEAEGFNKDNQQKSVNSQDASKFSETDGVKVEHLNQNQYDKNNYNQNTGQEENEIKKNVGHHKGHHKSGFHNSYHKDESGSNSSYFDNANDEGSNYVYDGRRKKYDGSGSEKAQGQNYNNQQYNRNQGQQNLYDNRGNLRNDRGDRGYYNQRQHYDDREQYAKNLADGRYNQGVYSAHNKYYNRPHYTQAYDPYYYDRYPRYVENERIQTTPLGHTIRILEDPRYVNDGYSTNRHYPRYEGHYNKYYDDRYQAVRAPKNYYY
ncbi:TBC1 domain family member 5 homolog A-like [Harmonia axyridis]|uniref:TBC1 domain family member 5 homolog A-like n=1 Tax=Harmonia axyridis TaxID=115357 RepID=UPI001E274FD6|nr:TBC1 domain family member 5 homolog A-like [Harmonia axyridis]